MLKNKQIYYEGRHVLLSSFFSSIPSLLPLSQYEKRKTKIVGFSSKKIAPHTVQIRRNSSTKWEINIFCTYFHTSKSHSNFHLNVLSWNFLKMFRFKTKSFSLNKFVKSHMDKHSNAPSGTMCFIPRNM